MFAFIRRIWPWSRTNMNEEISLQEMLKLDPEQVSADVMKQIKRQNKEDEELTSCIEKVHLQLEECTEYFCSEEDEMFDITDECFGGPADNESMIVHAPTHRKKLEDNPKYKNTILNRYANDPFETVKYIKENHPGKCKRMINCLEWQERMRILALEKDFAGRGKPLWMKPFHFYILALVLGIAWVLGKSGYTQVRIFIADAREVNYIDAPLSTAICYGNNNTASNFIDPIKTPDGLSTSAGDYKRAILWKLPSNKSDDARSAINSTRLHETVASFGHTSPLDDNNHVNSTSHVVVAEGNEYGDAMGSSALQVPSVSIESALTTVTQPSHTLTSLTANKSEPPKWSITSFLTVYTTSVTPGTNSKGIDQS